MVTGAALTHAKNIERFLDFSSEEHPIALQVGGSDTSELRHAAKLANQWNYGSENTQATTATTFTQCVWLLKMQLKGFKMISTSVITDVIP